MSDDSLPPSTPFGRGSDPAQTLATIAPVARQSVVDAVADRLRGEILSGRLRPGSPLVKGLKLADPAWHELVRSALELRRILAVEAVGLAAERHTEEDLLAISNCTQVLREHVDDPVAFARADLAFMRAVCKAARNVGLELFLNTFARWPDEHPQLVCLLYDDCSRSAALYPTIVELIKSRDGEVARSLARAALVEIDGVWSRRHPPPAPLAVPGVVDIEPVSANAKRKGKMR